MASSAPPSLFHTLPPAPENPNVTVRAPSLRDEAIDRDAALERLRARARSLPPDRVEAILRTWTA